MAEVILRNTKRKPFIATMYHGIVCRRRSACSCIQSNKVGPSGKRVTQKSPTGFQVDALSQLRIFDAVLALPDVQKAIKSGWLSREVAPPVKAAKAKAAAMPAPAAMKDNKKKGRG